MDFAIKFAFDILAFTSVMALIVLLAFGSYEFVEGVEVYVDKLGHGKRRCAGRTNGVASWLLVHAPGSAGDVLD